MTIVEVGDISNCFVGGANVAVSVLGINLWFSSTICVGLEMELSDRTSGVEIDLLRNTAKAARQNIIVTDARIKINGQMFDLSLFISLNLLDKTLIHLWASSSKIYFPAFRSICLDKTVMSIIKSRRGSIAIIIKCEAY